MAQESRSVFITGAGGGLGAAVCGRFVKEGWTVFAADLKPPPAAENIIPVQVDVTDTDSVDAAMDLVDEQAPEGLDCVVTMAGLMSVGALAEMPDDKLQRIVNVNIMGTHRVVRAAFERLRPKKGRVILISSETGWQTTMPFNGAYSLTKHAIESYGDALRRELAMLGMSVSIVQPGPFRTNMTEAIGAEFKAATIPGSPFEKLGAKFGPTAAKEHGKANDPSILADVVFDAATSSRPKVRYAVKNDTSRSVISKLPTAVVDRLLAQLLR
jgi:NAD(P)-dependent dehydrogenase (short-subunit alcohol dehydrogenase family)